MRAHVLVNVKANAERQVAKEIHRLTHAHGGTSSKVDVIFGDKNLFVTVEVPNNECLSAINSGLQDNPQVTQTLVYVVATIDLEDEQAELVTETPA